MSTTVHMHFGDGSYKLIEVEAEDPDEATEEARTWVKDNAWFEVVDDQGDSLSDEIHFYDDRRR